MNYDFSVLSDYEFEKLVNKLLTKKDVVVEQYRIGKDQGYDGLFKAIPSSAMIQAKHYVKSDFSQLKRKLKNEELFKIRKAKPSAYVLATSYNLTHTQTEELRKLIEVEVSNVTILGYESICSLLDNDSKTLKSMVKLWCGHLEIAKHVLNPERISRFIELNSKINDKRKIFVETPDLKNVIDQLQESHVVIIAGEPGVGKTTLAEHLCYLHLGMDYDVQIFEGDFSRESYDLTNPDEKILFYFDDFLGSNYLNCLKDKSDSAIVKFIERIQKEPNKRFILTSRTHIVNKAQEYSQAYRNYKLNKKQYIVDIGKYDELTKAKILYNHLKYSDLEIQCLKDIVNTKEYERIINHRNFNPRLIEFITKKENFDDCRKSYVSFVKNALDTPNEIWENCFTAQLNHHQRLLVKLVVANQGSIVESILKNAYIKAIQLYALPTPEQESFDYEYVFRICERCMLKRTIECSYYPKKEEHVIIRVFNPSVSDYVLSLISNENDAAKLCEALRTIQSLEILNLLKNDKEQIMHALLNKYFDDDWCDAKLFLMAELKDCQRINDLVKAIDKSVVIITKENRDFIRKIINNSINIFDWSNFIMNVNAENFHSSFYYNTIYDNYKDCKFCKENVLKIMHANVVKLIKQEVNSDLTEQIGTDYEITESDVYAEFDNYIGSLKIDFSYLDEDDIESIEQEIDANRIVDEINAVAHPNRLAEEYDNDDDFNFASPNDRYDEIQKMFLDLLE